MTPLNRRHKAPSGGALRPVDKIGKNPGPRGIRQPVDFLRRTKGGDGAKPVVHSCVLSDSWGAFFRMANRRGAAGPGRGDGGIDCQANRSVRDCQTYFPPPGPRLTIAFRPQSP